MKGKICLLGDPAVGKTSLIRKYVLDQFSDNYLSTIGAKVTKKEIQYAWDGNQIELMLMIWDIMGQKEDYSSSSGRFPAYKPSNMYFRDAKAAIIVADISRYETFENLDFWITSLMREVKEEIPIVFLANKVDLLDESQWSREAITSEFAEYNAPSFITSAKTGEGVADSFYEIGRAVIEKEL
jgi:small GTP-binding protein